MKICFSLVFLSLIVCSCETETFDKDKRQIMAKDFVMGSLRTARNFDIVSFKEDTLSSWNDSLFKRPIRYSLNVVFTDSTGTQQHRTGEAIFTPDGKSLMTIKIENPAQ